jgi:phosphoribosylformylglycinamidine synthase
LLAAPIAALHDIKLSANWMAACGDVGSDSELYFAVQAASDFCAALKLAIPVGKDSLSMRARWQDGGAQQTQAPLSLIASGFAPIADLSLKRTPELDPKGGDLYLIDLSRGGMRLGASVLSSVLQRDLGATPDAEFPEDLLALHDWLKAARGLVQAYHDRSDGGAWAALCEMAFTRNIGLDIQLQHSGELALAELFNEELGVIVQLQDARALPAKLRSYKIASLRDDQRMVVRAAAEQSLDATAAPLIDVELAECLRHWHQLSYQLVSERDNPATAAMEYAHYTDPNRRGLQARIAFDPEYRPFVPALLSKRPKVAILREQGVNGQIEMAAAFTHAGFECVDVHMSDLASKRRQLSEFQGLAACGGFSFGDVLGAGLGWAKSILFNPELSAMFAQFFADPTRFALGVCNGCQMLSGLKSLIPGAHSWPNLRRNLSEQYEARLVQVSVERSNSIFLQGMEGSVLPIVVSHGEGRAVWDGESSAQAGQQDVCLRMVDGHYHPTEVFPWNSNGSPQGATGFSAADGRVLMMMPHPERIYRAAQMSYRPAGLSFASPWLRVFHNARAFVK